MRNIDVIEKESSGIRKVALGSWRHPRDPSTYVEVKLEAQPALDFISNLNEKNITLTYFVAKVAAHCIKSMPEMNSVILRGKLHSRKNIDLFISTALNMNGEKSLSGFVLHDVPNKSLTEISGFAAGEVNKLRRNECEMTKRIEKRMRQIPHKLLVPFFRMMEFIQYTLNIAPRSWRIPKDRFGSLIITNYGALGIEKAFSPLLPCAHSAGVMGIGKVFDDVVAKSGKAEIQKSVYLTFTFDHRYFDGLQGAKFLRRFRKIFEDPQANLDVFQGSNNAD